MNWLEPGRKRYFVTTGILVLGISVFHARGILPGQTFLPVDLANNNLPWRSGPPQPLHDGSMHEKQREDHGLPPGEPGELG